MENLKNVDKEIHRVEGQLYETIHIKDDEGKDLRQINIPLKVEMNIRDYLEIIVGASMLAVPVAFTEEVWDLGDQLPWINAFILSLVSILFFGSFVYFTTYRQKIHMFGWEFLRRILSIFFLSLVVVGFLLTIVGKCPWLTDFDVALKRTIIGAFPASMSATVTDSLS